uniref:Uncharacterized protein n=1 Tax=Anguilla anguilla TaxID=7936 RepID=A0A0E9XI99_ANGAN
MNNTISFQHTHALLLFCYFQHILCQRYYFCDTNIQFVCHKGRPFNMKVILN